MAAAHGRKGPLALVVDDDEAVRACAVDLFVDLGFEVLEAGDGEAALALVHEHHDIALLFTDCRMPHMDGPTLAALAGRIRPDLAIVLTTGYAPVYPRAWPLLLKPYTAADVTAVLARVLPAALRAAA